MTRCWRKPDSNRWSPWAKGLVFLRRRAVLIAGHPEPCPPVAINAQKPDNGARRRWNPGNVGPKSAGASTAARLSGVGGRRHARIFGAAEEADNQSVEDLRRGDNRRHARFLRFSTDSVRSGVHRKGLEPDLWPGGSDTAVVGNQCTLGLAVLWLAGRQDRPAQGHDHHDPELFDRDGIDGADPGAWLGVSGGLPLLCRVRRYRPLYGRHCRGARVRARLEARLDHWRDHHDVAGGVRSGGGARAVRRGLYRLARSVRDRAAAGGIEPADPRLGSRIAALADARGPSRGGASISRLGVDGRPEGDP